MKDLERRINKKWKMKENKKHPYQKSNPFRFRKFSTEPRYEIVNENGTIIERFRNKSTASKWLPELKEKYFNPNLKIEKIK